MSAADLSTANMSWFSARVLSRNLSQTCQLWSADRSVCVQSAGSGSASDHWAQTCLQMAASWRVNQLGLYGAIHQLLCNAGVSRKTEADPKLVFSRKTSSLSESTQITSEKDFWCNGITLSYSTRHIWEIDKLIKFNVQKAPNYMTQIKITWKKCC